jgi:hypothetical protein
MADNDTYARAYGRSSEQNPNLGSVDRLVGTSEMSETCKERWPSGAWRAASSSSGASTSGRGGGQRIRGIEVIEHERPFGAERGDRVALLRQHERFHGLRVGA